MGDFTFLHIPLNFSVNLLICFTWRISSDDTGGGKVHGYLLSFANSTVLTELDDLEDYQPTRQISENLDETGRELKQNSSPPTYSNQSRSEGIGIGETALGAAVPESAPNSVAAKPHTKLTTGKKYVTSAADTPKNTKLVVPEPEGQNRKAENRPKSFLFPGVAQAKSVLPLNFSVNLLICFTWRISSDDTGGGKVHGYLLSFANSTVLTELDDLEDYQPTRQISENLDDRQYIKTFEPTNLSLGSAWVYLMTPEKIYQLGGICLVDGCWKSSPDKV